MASTSRLPSALTAVATTLPAYAGIPRRADLGAAALLAYALGERVEPEVAVGSAVARPLENSQLTGSIPASLGDLPDLVILQLYGNTMLTDCIPESLRGITINDLSAQLNHRPALTQR